MTSDAMATFDVNDPSKSVDKLLAIRGVVSNLGPDALVQEKLALLDRIILDGTLQSTRAAARTFDTLSDLEVAKEGFEGVGDISGQRLVEASRIGVEERALVRQPPETINRPRSPSSRCSRCSRRGTSPRVKQTFVR